MFLHWECMCGLSGMGQVQDYTTAVLKFKVMKLNLLTGCECTYQNLPCVDAQLFLVFIYPTLCEYLCLLLVKY